MHVSKTPMKKSLTTMRNAHMIEAVKTTAECKMETYQYHWVDAYEDVKGTVETYDISHVALLISMEVRN
jgi:hypothetical protein